MGLLSWLSRLRAGSGSGSLETAIVSQHIGMVVNVIVRANALLPFAKEAIQTGEFAGFEGILQNYATDQSSTTEKDVAILLACQALRRKGILTSNANISAVCYGSQVDKIEASSSATSSHWGNVPAYRVAILSRVLG